MSPIGRAQARPVGRYPGQPPHIAFGTTQSVVPEAHAGYDASSAERERMVARSYPRPTNGILVAITVMNSTLASGGRLAM